MQWCREGECLPVRQCGNEDRAQRGDQRIAFAVHHAQIVEIGFGRVGRAKSGKELFANSQPFAALRDRNQPRRAREMESCTSENFSTSRKPRASIRVACALAARSTSVSQLRSGVERNDSASDVIHSKRRQRCFAPCIAW